MVVVLCILVGFCSSVIFLVYDFSEVLMKIGCSGIGDESLLALARHSRSLARLDVRGCSRITEVGLEACDRDLKGCRIFAQRSHV